jgi:hypothetical protein
MTTRACDSLARGARADRFPKRYPELLASWYGLRHAVVSGRVPVCDPDSSRYTSSPSNPTSPLMTSVASGRRSLKCVTSPLLFVTGSRPRS